ncbi:PilZ domain-containing protein [Singulisphaera sp. GP187]|nr:PilZ domain-containing protein [Singulisphaera sp. GP187]
MWKSLSRSDVPSPTESTCPPAAQRPADTSLATTNAVATTTSSPSPEPSRQNRRGSTRYTAVNESLWVGWWAGDEFVLIDAQLVNISAGGVQISIATAPDQGQVVWMRLEGTSAQGSLAALVLEARWNTLRRRYVVRLEFQEPCRLDILTTAISGK